MKNYNKKTVGCALAIATVAITGAQAGEPAMMPAPAPIVSDCPWEIGLEALWLKAHSNEGHYDNQDYEFAYRLDASYKQGDSLGYRLTYFNYEGSDATDYAANKSSGMQPKIDLFDLEVFDTFELGAWNGEFSGGIRFGSIEEIEYDRDLETDFSGWGPTIGLEMKHQLVGDLSIYAGVRGSWLFGKDKENADNSSTFIAEGTLGLQYDFALFNSCNSYVRLGMEAQNYTSISDGDNEDIGLFGGSLKVGFTF